MQELTAKGKQLLDKIQKSSRMHMVTKVAWKTNPKVQLERRKHEYRFFQIQQQLEERNEVLQNQRSPHMCTILETLVQSRIVKGGRGIKEAAQAVRSLGKYLSWEQLLQWLKNDNESFNRKVTEIIKKVKSDEWLKGEVPGGKIYPNRTKPVSKNTKLQENKNIRPDEQMGGATIEIVEKQPMKTSEEKLVEGSGIQSNDRSITMEFQDFLKDQEWIEQCDIMDGSVSDKLSRMLTRYTLKWSYWSKQQLQDLPVLSRTLIMLLLVQQLQEDPILGVFEDWNEKRVDELVWLANNPALLIKEYSKSKCSQSPGDIATKFPNLEPKN